MPGEKKVVGPRAQRLYEEKKAKGEIPIKPIPEAVNCDIDRAPAAERRAGEAERPDHRRDRACAGGVRRREEGRATRR